MSTITAERVRGDFPAGRALYKLSQPTTSEEHPEPFEFVVLSFGRDGDTCAFPANERGGIEDFFGFGFGMGPSRHLDDSELDAYVQECIDQHERDGGSGFTTYREGNRA